MKSFQKCKLDIFLVASQQKSEENCVFEDAVHLAEVNFVQNVPDSRCLTIKGVEP